MQYSRPAFLPLRLLNDSVEYVEKGYSFLVHVLFIGSFILILQVFRVNLLKSLKKVN